MQANHLHGVNESMKITTDGINKSAFMDMQQGYNPSAGAVRNTYGPSVTDFYPQHSTALGYTFPPYSNGNANPFSQIGQIGQLTAASYPLPVSSGREGENKVIYPANDVNDLLNHF